MDAPREKPGLGFLSKHPLCVTCRDIGRIVAAEVVDHIIPHRGDRKLFWDRSNWQSLCSRCHNGLKQRQEPEGIMGASVLIAGQPSSPLYLGCA